MIPDDFCRCCITMERIYIPDTIEIIGKLAFLGCDNLRDIRLSNRLTVISKMLFHIIIHWNQ